MKTRKLNAFNLITATLILFSCSGSFAQIVVDESFESGSVPTPWTASGGSSTLSISSLKFKAGNHSLKWAWAGGASMTGNNPYNLSTVCANSGSGFYGWVYNDVSQSGNLKVEFTDAGETISKSFNMPLNFKGWRCIYVGFQPDLGYNYSSTTPLTKIRFTAPPTGSGNFYFDMFDIQTSVLWHRSPDLFVHNNGGGPDFITPRNIPFPPTPTPSSDELAATSTIASRIESWFLDKSLTGLNSANQALFSQRIDNTNRWISTAVPSPTNTNTISKYVFQKPDANTINLVDDSGNGIGIFTPESGYSPLGLSSISNGVVLQLALDYRINGNVNSKNRCIDYFNWMIDQGWADGSVMGTSYFVNISMVGLVHAFFLMRNDLPDSTYQNMRNALYWYLQYGNTFASYTPYMDALSADNLRALGLANLEFAMCYKTDSERVAAAKGCQQLFNYIFGTQTGYTDIFKSDFSTYHHQQNYTSEYGDDALHQACFLYYLMYGTGLALYNSLFTKLKNTILRYDLISTNLRTPSGTGGRFADARQNMADLSAAFTYLAYSNSSPDQDLLGAFTRLCNNNKLIDTNWFMKWPGISISFTSGLGASKIIALAKQSGVPANAEPSQTVFAPYSGMLISRKHGWLATIKGFSKYITDFECIRYDGRYARYLGYGNFQLSSEIYKRDSYTPNNSWDWSHFPGTTAINLTPAQLDVNQSGSQHLNSNWIFGDIGFLGGGNLNDSTGVFSAQLHDITFSSNFNAKKSMFHFGDFIFFMGSNISNTDGANSTHTTLFQNLATGSEKCFVNDVAVTSVTTINAGISNTVKILDNWNNVYLVYSGNDQVVVNSRQQQFPDNAGTLKAATPYFTAWLNHGISPGSAGYKYGLLIQPNTQAIANAISDPPVIVKQQNYAAHIIYHKTRKIYGYAFFGAVPSVTNGGKVKAVYQPSIIMEEDSVGSGVIKTIMFQDPDLRRPAGDEMLSNQVGSTDGTMRLDSIDLSGKYSLINQVSGLTIRYFPASILTRLYFNSQNGNQFIARLLPLDATTTAFTPGNLALVRINTASSSGSQVFIDELDNQANLVQSIPLDSVYQPTANTSTEEGYLTLSGDKQYIGLTGYVKAAANLYGTSSSDVKRVVAIIRYDGNVTTSAVNPDLFSNLLFKPKSLYTSNGRDFWLGYGHLSTDYAGLMYGTLNSDPLNPVSLTSITKWHKGGGVRQLNLDQSDQKFYFNTGASSLNYYSSTTLPKDSSSTSASINVTGVGGAKGFCFVSSGSADYLYVAISNASTSPAYNGILRYKKNSSGGWDANGGYGSSIDNYLAISCAPTTSNGIVDIFVIRKTNSNQVGELARVRDNTASANMSVVSDSLLIAQNSAKAKIYRGISMVPAFNLQMASYNAMQVITDVPAVATVATIATVTKTNAKKLILSPNPATTSFKLFYETTSKGAYIQIATMNGIKLRTIPVSPDNDQTTISVSDLSPGTYTVSFVDKGISVTKLFIKL